MSKLKLVAPTVALAIGALGMVGMYAFADTTAPAPATTTVSAQTQVVDDHNKGADIETADDTASTAASDTDNGVNEDKGSVQQQQNDQQDPGQLDGETND